MAEDLLSIRRYVQALVRRERVLLLLAMLGRSGLVLALAMALAGLAPGLHLRRPAVAAGVVLVLGVGLWLSVAVPWLREWARSGDVIRQARLVEAGDGQFRGRLVTAVERLDGAHGQESVAIVGLVARRAAQGLQRVRPDAVHSARRAMAWNLGAALGVPLVLCLGLVISGPTGVWSYWSSAGSAHAALADGGSAGATETARVGDLVLRYVYPDYTGLEPLEVPNSTGDAHGPPGTRVEVVARSADAIDAAALQAYAEPPVDVAIVDGRTLSGSFTIQSDPGTWQLVLFRGATERSSRAFQVTPEPDMAPEVVLALDADSLQVAVDQVLGLQWSARDDFGIERVMLDLGGVEARALQKDLDGAVDAQGVIQLTPKQLGLRVGQRAKLRVVAYDNDGWTGSKAGASREIELVVLDTSGEAMLGVEAMVALRDVLVDLLAKHLVEAWPVGLSGQDFSRWGERVARRYEPLRAHIADNAAITHDPIVWYAVADALRSATNLVRFSQTSFLPGDAEAADTAVVTSLGDLRDDAVQAVEYSVLRLDRAVVSHALADAEAVVAEMAGRAGALERRAKDSNRSVDELLAELPDLRESNAALQAAVSRLPEDSVRGMIDQRRVETEALLGELERAIEGADAAGARTLAKRLAQHLREVQADLAYRREQAEMQGNELQQEGKALMQELAEAERKQRDLAGQMAEHRMQADGTRYKAQQDAWAVIIQKSERAAALSQAYVDGLERAKRGFNERTRAEGAAGETERLLHSARGANLGRAQRDVMDAELAWNYSYLIWTYYAQSETLAGPDGADITRIRGLLDQVAKLLNRMALDGRSSNPEVLARAREMAQEQSRVAAQIQELQKKGEEFAQKMPIQPRGFNEAMEQAGESAQRGEDELRSGRPMVGEGYQGQSADHLQEAQDALREAMQQMAREESGAGGGPPQEGDEGGRGDEDTLDLSAQHLLLEEAQRDDDYRRALLEGMQGDVPDEYRAMKKRYFEELVKQ